MSVGMTVRVLEGPALGRLEGDPMWKRVGSTVGPVDGNVVGDTEGMLEGALKNTHTLLRMELVI